MSEILTTNRIREALAHFIDLAACFEYREPGASDPPAEKTLLEVVHIIEKHRMERDNAEKHAVEDILVDETAYLYRQTVDDESKTAAELQEALLRIWKRWKRDLDEEALDALVLTAEEIREQGGPKEASVCAVAEVLGINGRTLYNRQKKVRSVLEPTAFGIRLGRQGGIRYLREVTDIDDFLSDEQSG